MSKPPLCTDVVAAWALFAVGSLGTGASPALAYSNTDQFAQPAVNESGGGGGGERWFTGSVADGYSCDVCHVSDREATFTVTTDLQDGYRPGTAHEIEIEWPEDAMRTGAVIELIGEGAVAAGTLETVDEAMLGAEERCGGGLPATRVLAGPPERALVGVDACGASRVRVRWPVPAEQVRRVWLHVALVHGDGSGSPEGDVTGARALPISLEGAPPEDAIVGEGGCSVPGAGPVGSSRGRGYLVLALVLLGLAAVRGRAREITRRPRRLTVTAGRPP